MLLSKGKITQDLVNMLVSWRHSGFNVFCGRRIQPGEEEAMENLARYIIRAFLSRLAGFLSGEDDLCSRKVKGYLSVEGWKKGKDL